MHLPSIVYKGLAVMSGLAQGLCFLRYKLCSKEHAVLLRLPQHIPRSTIWDRLVGHVVKASTPRLADLGLFSTFAVDLFQVEPYQWLQSWYFSGYPARCPALKGQCWDWSDHG